MCWYLIFDKVADLKPATLFKKKYQHVFFCKFCEIFKNIFFYRTPPIVVSANGFSAGNV